MIYIYHKSCLKMGKVGLLGFLVDDLVDNLFGIFGLLFWVFVR